MSARVLSVDQLDLTGKVIVVTGANGGIGKATALALASRGGSVILACRNQATGAHAEHEIRQASGNNSVRTIELDLADLRSVERCANTLRTGSHAIDVLVNNAGAAFWSRTLTPQGFERTFAVNYLGHYALTRLLLPDLVRTPGARVITVSSNGHKFTRGIRWDDLSFEQKYSSMTAYANAKLAEVLFTRELARRYGPSGLVAHAVHPGFVGSGFYDSAGPRALSAALGLIVRGVAKTPETGAATSIFLVSSDEAGHQRRLLGQLQTSPHLKGSHGRRCGPTTLEPQRAAHHHLRGRTAAELRQA